MEDEELEVLAFDAVLHKTEMAALLDLGGGEQHWFPFSEVPALQSDFDVGDGPDEVEVPVWLLTEKGLT